MGFDFAKILPRDQKSLLFYTCANFGYQDFVPLYAVSALYHNKNAICEVGLQEGFQHDPLLVGALSALKEIFGEDRFRWESVPWTTAANTKRRIAPGTVRFITTPRSKADFVYIGDVDIIILEEITPPHVANMAKTGLPYSNIVRKGTVRLTGLHFSEYDAYYPLPSLQDVDICASSDEAVLYQLVSRQGHRIAPENTFRPVHGIHMSPNREPQSTASVRLKWYPDKYEKQYRKFVAAPEFRLVSRYFSERIRSNLHFIDLGFWQKSR